MKQLHVHFRVGSAQQQAGATLIVAIMMLLIITLLALSSMRGVSLESRITGNLKQQKALVNAAEAGLRIGEASIKAWKCTIITGNPNKPCIALVKAGADANADTPQLFNIAANLANLNSVTGSYGNLQIQWYVVDLRFLGGPVQNGCGLMSRNCSTHYYEITACASTVLCSSDTTTQRVILRTVVSISDS